MKQHKTYNEHIYGSIKDFFIIALLFAGFYFLDIELASFVAVIITIILLTRRVIVDYNPGFVKGHHIIYHDMELDVPKEVDIFDLGTVPSMEYLYKYTEVIRGILLPPRILIIRFSEIIEIKESEFNILSEVILRLRESGIGVIISDAAINIQTQLRQHGIETIAGEEKIFDNIKDALAKAKIISGRNQNLTNNTFL